jgi:hypothetical protein
MITYLHQTFMQNVVKLAPLISALHTPWCHFISSLWWVCLVEYLLVLRVYSHLLQVVMYHGYCKNWLAPAVVAECGHGLDPSELSCLSCFCWNLTLVLACIWIKKKLVSNYFASTTLWTWVVITLWNSDLCWITCNNGCNMWLVMLNHYDLGLYIGWFEIPRDFIGLLEL